MRVAVAAFGALEFLLHEGEFRSARRCGEGHRDFGLVAAHPALVLPGPAEDEATRRLDRAIAAAHRVILAVGGAHRGAPRAAGARVDSVTGNARAFGAPPFHELVGLGPEREKALGRRRDEAFETQLLVAHVFLRFGVSAATTASSRSSAPFQCIRCFATQASTEARASGRTRMSRHCRSMRRSMRPARSSTCKCREIAGMLIAKGAAMSPTESSPLARSRSTI